jgi:FtsZ-binding cell division protein ZapB
MGINLAVRNDMSKEEEIAILNKLVDVFKVNPDNYLASLFTDQLSVYLQKQISQDGSTDLMEYVTGYYEKEAAVIEARNIRDLEIAELKEKNEEQYRQHQATVENYCDNATRDSKDIQDMMDTIRELRSDRANQINKIYAMEKGMENQDAKICALKAKLYDIEHKD